MSDSYLISIIKVRFLLFVIYVLTTFMIFLILFPTNAFYKGVRKSLQENVVLRHFREINVIDLRAVIKSPFGCFEWLNPVWCRVSDYTSSDDVVGSD